MKKIVAILLCLMPVTAMAQPSFTRQGSGNFSDLTATTLSPATTVNGTSFTSILNSINTTIPNLVSTETGRAKTAENTLTTSINLLQQQISSLTGGINSGSITVPANTYVAINGGDVSNTTVIATGAAGFRTLANLSVDEINASQTAAAALSKNGGTVTGSIILNGSLSRSVATGIVGTGYTLASAKPLTSYYNTISTCSAGGVSLAASVPVGGDLYVVNRCGFNLYVFPDTAADQIESLGAGNYDLVASGYTSHYFRESASLFRRIQ